MQRPWFKQIILGPVAGLETTLVYFPDIFGVHIFANPSSKDFTEQFSHTNWHDNAAVMIHTKSVTFVVDRDD